MNNLMDTYSRLPVTFDHGVGCLLYDDQGREYLDALAGVAVNTLGHAHPRLADQISEQARRLLHVSNIYRIQEQEKLAARLVSLSGMQEVFFCNSGCEANEAAIKLARLYGHQRAIEQPTTIVMQNAFHGRTLATLSATGHRKVQAGFEPLVGGFVRAPLDDYPALEQIISNSAMASSIVAILLEPVQGESGIQLTQPSYLQAVRRLCDERQWLFMVDEVQCGMGRTGTWFAHQHADIVPDVMTLAKGLGSGVPIGACLAAGKAAGVFKPGNHGSTFGGNPLACVSALTTLDVIAEDDLLSNAERMGRLLLRELHSSLSVVEGVVEVRGCGLMVGIELACHCGDLVNKALQEGLLINVTAQNVIRLLPPLIIDEPQILRIADIVSRLVTQFLQEPVARYETQSLP